MEKEADKVQRTHNVYSGGYYQYSVILGCTTTSYFVENES
jgi:hypothetical protein